MKRSRKTKQPQSLVLISADDALIKVQHEEEKEEAKSGLWSLHKVYIDLDQYHKKI